MSIQHMQHDHPGLKYLESHPNILRVSNPERQGLPHKLLWPAFSLMTAISELAKHLLERQSWFQYFLTGKLTSASFRRTLWMVPSQYGGNYLTSVKHRPHSEKRSTASVCYSKMPC